MRNRLVGFLEGLQVNGKPFKCALISISLALAVVLSLVPLMMSKDYSGTKWPDCWRTSSRVTLAFASCIFVSMPLLVDILFDCYSQATRPVPVKDASGKSPFKLCLASDVHERMLILISTVLPGAAFFLGAEWNLSNEAFENLILTLTVTQRILFVYPMLAALNSSSSGLFKSHRMIYLGCLWATTQLLSQYVDYPLPAFQTAFAAARLGIFGLIILPLTWWVVQYLQFLYAGGRERVKKDCKAVIFCGFLIVFAISVIMRTTMFSTAIIVYTTYIVALFAMIGTIVPGRLARFQCDKSMQQLEVKQCFIRYISHEIRTPLNVSFIGLSILEDGLQKRGVMDEETRELLAQMRSANNTAIETLNDILSYDRLVNDVMTLDRTSVNAVEFFKQSFHIFAFQARKCDVTFSLPSRADPAIQLLLQRTVSVDAHKMAQVCRNLGSNAIKFTPPGGHIAVKLSAFREYSDPGYMPGSVGSGKARSPPLVVNATTPNTQTQTRKFTEWLRMEVIDSGEGLEADKIADLFHDDVKFDANCLNAGKTTGLGLVLTQGIVELHGGRIWAHSEGLGKGCNFVVELPLEPAAFSASLEEKVDSSERNKRQSMSFNAARIAPMDQDEPGRLQRAASADLSFDRMETADSQTLSPTKEGPLPTERDFTSAPLLDLQKTGASPENIWTRTNSKKPELTSRGMSSARMECTELCNVSGLNILCVDDSLVNLKMTVLLFKKMGAVCSQAADGHLAVEMVSESLEGNGSIPPFDMIVMDNLMPTMNGPEACAAMRAMGFRNPIFGLTGHALEADIRRYKAMGATEIFLKPLNTEEFLCYLTQHCGSLAK